MATVTSSQKFTFIAVLVPSYDEGIRYFVDTLSFTLTSDVAMGGTKRWVVVHPPNTTGCGLVLAVPSNDTQKAAVGNQTGGRVFLFLHSDNFWEDYARMKEKGVDFTEEPRKEVYGNVVVFRDPWGNHYDFMGPPGEWQKRLGIEETLTSCSEQ
jgi:catechol 2,3-dioxygenase-like lactoylglutathione lyase family enzyme